MDYGICKKCKSTGFINYEKPYPELYGDNRLVMFAEPCDCTKGIMIKNKWINAKIIKGDKDGA